MASPPTRPALRARYDARRLELIEAAAKAFAQHGYHATTIEHLIEASGLTRGGIYHYTQSKRDLLLAVIDELTAPLLAEAAEVVERPQPPEAHLRELLRLWLRHVASHRDHMIVFAQERRTLERGSGWGEVRDARARFETMLREVIDRGEREGSFAIRDRQLTMLMLLGAVNYTPQWFEQGRRLSPEQIADLYCDTLLDGIRAR
jgi:TetR/AcrR family transcriptional regulator, cholesterol catabolism regulator